MQLPQTIQSYFAADRKNNCEALLDCFAPDATVHDEGRSHSGHYAIGSWWEQSKAKYRHMTEPLESAADDHGVRVLAKVTGAFPGSPANLTYAFRLSGEKIVALEIGA